MNIIDFLLQHSPALVVAIPLIGAFITPLVSRFNDKIRNIFRELQGKDIPIPDKNSIASLVYDTTIPGATLDHLSWNESLQANTYITFDVRASDTPFAEDDVTLAWTPVGETSPVTSGLPSGRYIQWRATLISPDTSKTPILHEVNLEYY